ncbi:MAG TPA: glutamate synthase-related protein, partial [Candidatus Binatia bacterium]|nr:glutamate synthase-related protein [Candidatus Binatia bacterium]
EMLLVDPARGLVLEDAEAKAEALRSVAVVEDEAVRARSWSSTWAALAAARPVGTRTPLPLRFLAGLDAEKARLDIKTMALEAKEPLWSMGDDTPLAGLARVDRPVSDHLRQAFAQVTNPAIDPEREQVVMDLSVELGRRAPLLGGPPDDRRAGRRRAWSRTVHLERPIVTDRAALVAALEATGRSVRLLEATWDPGSGEGGLRVALERLTAAALSAARAGTEVVVLSDRRFGFERLPIPSVLAVGAVHTALTEAGLRGRTDLVAEAADVLDVHGLAMVLASGATVVCPWLAVELAAELAGSRGAEALTGEQAVANLVAAFSAGLRKTLARMGISTVASYVGGALFEVLELDPDVLRRCFPSAPAWPGTVGFEDLARRQLRRLEAARAIPADDPRAKLIDPGFARFRGDGELHLYAPSVVGELQEVARTRDEIEAALARLRAVREHPPAVVRDGLRIRRARRPIPLDEVEPARAIVRRFVASAMSVGALSPEAHQAITIGIQRAGGAANTGEGGEDPAWYVPGPDGERHDARIKQVASARFGVTSQYLARADQIEIKIAQGSKPGEGGQLPGKKATAYIAALRRAQPGQSLISPPPHHDIYSIEDLAQLIADLRSINPWARIGVKLVATRGVGTIAAGVAKAGADYIHIAGHSGGTGASPLSSIKHVGAPWELGLAETHETLLRNDLRDRVVLRTDGGLQTGRDVLVAALLGAEEFGFGTAMLVAIGCDMAR